MDIKPLLSLVHETSRALGFTVHEPAPDSATRSFTAWRLTHAFEPAVTVVVHLVRPVFAVVEAAPDDHTLGSHVIDWQPEQLTRAADMGWHRLTADEARQAVTVAMTTGLTEEERREIAYWKPPTVGEVVFNHWD